MLAHRGDPTAAPENTLAAFEAAVEAGADMIETDVRLTADGVPVLLHDADLARTTDTAGEVHRMTLSEVKRARARGDHEVPTLAEALDGLAASGIGLDLEIKNLPGEASYDPEDRLLEATLAALEGAGWRGPLIVSSFNPATIRRCREWGRGIPTGLLTLAGDLDAAIAHALEAGHEWLLPHAILLHEAGRGFVEEARARGLSVCVWTVDEPEAIGTLFGWGVDALVSNRPAEAVRLRDAQA